MSGRRPPGRLLALLAAGLAAAALLHLGVAREAPGLAASLTELLHALGFGGTSDAIDAYVVGQLRLPRLLMAVFGGASLGLAGAVMQAAFRNPLASPDIVGTAAGAAFGGASAIVVGSAASALLAVPVGALLGAAVVTWAVFLLAGTGARFSVTGLLLAGVALNTLVGALTTFVVSLQFGNYSASSEVLFWLMGGLDARAYEHVAITGGGCLLFGGFAVSRVRDLDVLTLRDDTACSLGLDAGAARRALLWCACGLVGTTVANTGGIAFVGLIVPHVARLLVGPAHRVLLPAAALLGALVLVLADLLCQNAPADWNLRLGVVTSVLGAPWFLFLLARHRRGEALQ